MLPLLALLLASPPPDLAQRGAPGLAAIHASAISAHVRFLADDLLEGRGTGTRGHALAARYLSTELQALGYAPAGERGTWFQDVPLIGMTVNPEGCGLEVDGAPMRYGDDALFYPRAGSGADDVAGELVFAGYGVSAPEYRYDDVPKDLAGKIAVILYGAPRSDRPDFFPTAASAVYSDGWEKSKRLKARGAVGLVIVLTPEVEQHLPWPFFVRQAPFEQMVWREGEQAGTGYAIPTARVPAAQLQRFLARSGRKGADLFAAGPKGGLKPFALGMKGRLRTAAALRKLSSENVAGVLRGRERPDEYVVLTAHLDHLGIGPPIDGDAIYNGAVDDATGVSLVIEMARAFAALPERPPRSILVVGVTGEEKGLLGSDYFARHPTVPIAGIVADVNVDGSIGAWRPHDLIVLGSEHSTLERAASAALAASGLSQSPDPEPEQVFFIRSDQYSFVKQGIPAIFPGPGWKDERGDIAKNKATEDWWTKHRYHHPKDEWDPSQDYENLAVEARAVFLMALAVALDPERPRWNEGDVFARLYGGGRK
jgi:Peptidase family M28/PA domain